MTETASIMTKLYVKANGEGAAYKELYGMTSTPAMGGEPQKIDITNLSDRVERGINGVQQMNSLTFAFYKCSEPDTDTVINNNFDYLRTAMEDTSEAGVLGWKLEYPDGSCYEWTGRPNVYMNEVSVNSALSFSLTIGQETTMTYTPVGA